MRALLRGLIVGAGVMAPGSLEAGEYDRAWARVAGEHMGRAEAAATCPGYKINVGRRDQIIALYAARGLGKALEAERVKVRKDRTTAIGKDRKVCETLLAMYGPQGLAIRNYVLPPSAEDIPGQPGLDRGILLDVDPRGMAAMHWLGLSGYATVIETICQGYKMAPLVEAHHSLMGEVIGARQAMELAVASMAAAGQEYDLKRDRGGFCGRILKDYGPGSDVPVVSRKP